MRVTVPGVCEFVGETTFGCEVGVSAGMVAPGVAKVGPVFPRF